MKQLLYTLCFCFLCVIDQRKGSVTGDMQLFWSNCTGFAIALLIFSHYRIKDFLKLPYLVWTVLSGITFVVCMRLPQLAGMEMPWNPLQWQSGFANVFLYGFLIIHTIIDLRKHSLHAKKVLFHGLLCVMLTLMGLSRNDSVWPWYYLMVFGTFAFTDFSEKERRNLAFALADGVILGFFCIQGLAFVFRPYDQIRYLGMYANPNINALFYSVVYCALLVRLLYFLFECDGKRKLLLVPVAMFFSGAMWSFCMLTGCRTALLSMGIVTCVAGIYCITRFRRLVVLKVLGMITGLVLCMGASIPVVFGCIRYLPAYFHHPIWFYEEYSESKVHSWDPMDSQKYIDWDEMLEYILHRMLGITLPEEETQVVLEDGRGFPLLCSASEQLYGTTEPKPLVSEETDSAVARRLIYGYYLSNINMTGHVNEDNGVQVTPLYFAPHAHNLYLQMTFDFGIPIGILFLGYVLLSIVRLIRNVVASKSACTVGLLLLFVNGCVFGMLEMMWINGYIAFTILFLAPLIPGRKREEDVPLPTEPTG